MTAWSDVGGFDAERFDARGGDYEPGLPAGGSAPYWIAIEGLDGSGKSTMVSALAKAIDAQVVTNPPVNMTAERRDADQRPDAERRAWYRAANEAAAREALAVLATGRPVVMDRSHATTLAFAAAEDGRVAAANDWSAS